MSGAGDDRRERLRARLRGLGFDVVRFAAADAVRGTGLRAWLAAGHQADMAWIGRGADKREDPQLVLPGAATMVVLGVNYGGAGGGAWARYSLHTDYHDTIRPGLAAAGRILEEELGLGGDDHRYYVDTGPVLERGWAARAGAGFRGKNAMLISREFGNWLFLAVILVRAAIAPDGDGDGVAAAGTTGRWCGKCTRCLDVCPTSAFPEPGVVDARLCISYHTIENKGVVPRALRPAFGARLYGCDACLEVCPWNRFAQAARSALLERRPEVEALTLLEVLRLTPERFRAVFRGMPMKRTKLTGLLRNACIAAGNVWAREPGARPVSVPAGLADPHEHDGGLAEVRRLAAHESPVVRAHAVWALRRMLGDDAALAGLRAVETDPLVLEEHDAG